MFEIFYGFTATPFTKTITPASLFLSEQHQELLARLQYLSRNRGFGLVTGEVGAGKSTAIRSFASGLDPSHHQLLYISQSDLSSRHLYRELCLQLGLKPAFHAADTRRQLTQAVWDAYKNHDKQPTIVIDEAHLLSSAMLEEVRFLTNFHLDSASPMTLILVGQTELRQRFRLQTLEAITQRINLRYHLTGLSDLETKAYIIHHLKVAGVNQPIFSDEAIRVTYQFSKGIPRRINNLATACLLAGFMEQKSIIDEMTVKKALAEFQDDQVA